jgi:hypothetical protein
LEGCSDKDYSECPVCEGTGYVNPNKQIKYKP